jgi:AcrR family transcriptional regulator
VARATPPTRRTQDERRAVTRAALLDATIDCLAEHGYVHTTARLVAERAGVSRGACTHYFPTTHELVIAAIERTFDRLTSEFVATFTAMPAHDRTFARAVRQLWDIATGPSYAAVLEVVVASRTDPQLNDFVRVVAALLDSSVAAVVREVFPDPVDDAVRSAAIDLTMSIVQGAAVSRIAGFGDPDRAIELAITLATQLIDRHS